MEAGGPRSLVGGLSGKGTLPHWLEAGKTLLPGSMPEGELITEKASAPEHRARLRAWEREGEPWGRGLSPAPGGLRVLFIPALEAWALKGPPPRRASPVRPTLAQHGPLPSPSAFWSLLLGWAAPGPRAPPHLHASSPGAQASPPQGQAPPLPSAMGSAGRATAQMLRATPDLFLSEE